MPHPDLTINTAETAATEPDMPPESFWLSKDAEYDWFDRNAVYERKESTRGGNSNNSNSNSSNNAIAPNPNFNSSSSQRSSLISKASIIGLPKSQKTAFADSNRRSCKAVNTRLFPKQKKSTAAPAAVHVVEPGSPKVSCMGRVRSKRGRRKSKSMKPDGKPVEKQRTGEEKERIGFCSKVRSFFRCVNGRNKPVRSGSGKVVEEPVVAEPGRKSVGFNPVGGEPPGLGGVTRFTSGRRSGNWLAEEISPAI